jgi:hypothetical protein
MPDGPRRAVLAVLVGLALSGCATRRVLTIDSRPSGARIWVNGVEQARRTPVQVPFVHYGRFDVRLEREGYQGYAGELHVPSQIDGYPIVDLPLELMVRERRFHRSVDLVPLPPKPEEADLVEIRRRAEAFRAATHEAVGGGR